MLVRSVVGEFTRGEVSYLLNFLRFDSKEFGVELPPVSLGPCRGEEFESALEFVAVPATQDSGKT